MIKTAVGNYPKTPNLPRPARLRKAIADLDAGKITGAEFLQIEDEVTLEVIDEQIEAGLDLITDGKIRWEDEQTYIARALDGMAINGLIRYFDSNTYYRQPICEGPIRWTRPISVRDYTFAAEHSRKPVKGALTGPYTLARLSQNKHYPSLREFVMALAEALNREARALQGAGAAYIQFDEPAILRHKEDWDLFASAMERLTQGLTAKLALYTYFGDVSGIYPQILSLPFQVIGLDFVQGAHNWDVIGAAPFTKELGFGIINARNTKLESPAELYRAFDAIARIVPLDRVYVNPTSGLEFLPRERAQEKLANMARAVASYEAGEHKRQSKKLKAKSQRPKTGKSLKAKSARQGTKSRADAKSKMPKTKTSKKKTAIQARKTARGRTARP